MKFILLAVSASLLCSPAQGKGSYNSNYDRYSGDSIYTQRNPYQGLTSGNYGNQGYYGGSYDTGLLGGYGGLGGSNVVVYADGGNQGYGSGLFGLGNTAGLTGYQGVGYPVTNVAGLTGIRYPYNSGLGINTNVGGYPISSIGVTGYPTTSYGLGGLSSGYVGSTPLPSISGYRTGK